MVYFGQKREVFMNQAEQIRELYFQPANPEQYAVELFSAAEMMQRSCDKVLS